MKRHDIQRRRHVPSPGLPIAHRHAGQSGFTLIEILVALLVLSIGLIGLAMLQATGLKFNNDSYMRTQATILAYDLADRMRANIAGSIAGDYCITSTSPCVTIAKPSTPEDCGSETAGCSSASSLAAYDVTQWYLLQKLLLSPAATPSSFTRTTTTTASGKTVYQYRITMRWNERENDVEQTWVIEL